jgi:F-type H+-transporting ATPase subunit 8
MPQLVPFYYMNEIIFAFAIILILIVMFSKYILPGIYMLQETRQFINKFLKGNK